jgi:hypothetical protein
LQTSVGLFHRLQGCSAVGQEEARDHLLGDFNGPFQADVDVVREHMQRLVGLALRDQVDDAHVRVEGLQVPRRQLFDVDVTRDVDASSDDVHERRELVVLRQGDQPAVELLVCKYQAPSLR